MNDTPEVPADLTPPPTTEVPEVPKGGFNAQQAAQLLASRRGGEKPADTNTKARAATAEAAVERPTERAPAQESAPQGEDAAPPEEAPGEPADQDDAAGEPPVEPPRAWSKQDKELFKTLPRETQLRLNENERVREATIRKGLQENAERERALETQRTAMEEARTQYEQRLPAIVQMLQGELAKEFSDIKSMDDVVNLAQRDPARHGRFQALVQRAQAAALEQQQIDARKKQEAEAWHQNYTAEEDRKFLEAAPEFADPVKGERLRREAAETLTEKGFTEQDIQDMWSGKKPIHARDSRWQLILRDAMRFRAAQKSLPAAKAQPQQTTLKPGMPPSKGERQASNVTTLEQKLARTGKPQDAVELLRAKRAK